MIEIEKKYKLTEDEYDILKKYFYDSDEYDNIDSYGEENTLYSGIKDDEVLRVREYKYIGLSSNYVLTYKKLISNEDGLKKQTEIEVNVDYKIDELLSGLGYQPYLSYSKQRIDWYLNYADLTISLDKLVFGYFLEVEGNEEQILNFEDMLEWLNLKSKIELKSYPTMQVDYELGIR